MSNTLILTGMKHCGKSTLGKKLASQMSRSFYDLDDIIESSLKGMSIRSYFQQNGAESFKAREQEAVSKFSKIQGSEISILSTGGGIIDNPEAWDLLNDYGMTVYLKEAEDVLYNRIIRNGIPPFLDNSNPKNSFSELYAMRTEKYEKQCRYILDLQGSGIGTTLEKLIKLVKETINAR